MTAHSSIGVLERELVRVLERLRTLGSARVGAAYPGGGSVADAAHRLAQRLADIAAAHRGQPARSVPRLGDHAAADQLQVLGRELLAVADRVPETELTELIATLTEFRRHL